MSETVTDQLPLSRATHALGTVTDAVATLHDENTAHEPLEQVLARLADTAQTAVAGADAVSVTQLDERGPRTVALTDQSLAGLDGHQHTAARGPSLHAATTGEPVRAVVGEHADRWPEFTTDARAAGIRAHLSVPLILHTPGPHPGELPGSLNLYSRTTAAFDPFDEKLMELLTTAASAAISNARRWHRASTQVDQLTRALTSRADIDQAKGVLMATHRISSNEAFTRLTDISQRTNTKLHDVARNFMHQCTEKDPAPT